MYLEMWLICLIRSLGKLCRLRREGDLVPLGLQEEKVATVTEEEQPLSWEETSGLWAQKNQKNISGRRMETD